jgi:SAM-dependent methyltransferase
VTLRYRRGVHSYDDWFVEMWRFVQPALPPAPANVVEIGCGRFGGFVPRLKAAGYDAIGVDPDAPGEPGYERVEFERFQPAKPVDAVVACTSLHHVADLDLVLDLIAAALLPGGAVVIVEWARERFDEQTAQWCFDRLAEPAPDTEPGWLHARRDEFAASGQPWDSYISAWAEREGLHSAERIIGGLDARFERLSCVYGPYYFADLDGVTLADEQATIDSGTIPAGGVQYLATARIQPE